MLSESPREDKAAVGADIDELATRRARTRIFALAQESKFPMDVA